MLPTRRRRRGARICSAACCWPRAAIPGAFPPVLIDVEGNGKTFPGNACRRRRRRPVLCRARCRCCKATAATGFRRPQLYIVINSGLKPDFQVVEPSTPSILSQSVGMAVDSRFAADARSRFCRGEKPRHRLQRRDHSAKASTRRAAVPSIRNICRRCSRPVSIRAKATMPSPPRRRPIPARPAMNRAVRPRHRQAVLSNRERRNEEAW